MDPRSIVYVKDTVNSEFLAHAAAVVHQFHMPLLFALAGASTYFALRFRGNAQYLQERFLKLFVPAIFGLVALVPPLTYLGRVSRGEHVSLLTHYLHFFTYDVTDVPGYNGHFTPAHLWFILGLFAYSLLALPLFRWLSGRRTYRLRDALARFFSHRFALAAVGVVVALASAINVMGSAAEALGDQNPIVYFVFILAGFIAVTDWRYQTAIDRDWPFYLAAAAPIEIFRQLVNISLFPAWSPLWISVGLVTNANRWLWVFVILGLGHKYLNRDSGMLRYLSEAAFPFYLLHFPINALVAYFVVRIPAGVALKYILIVTITTAGTFLAYEALRRFRLMRFLMGMKNPPAPLSSGRTVPS
jgi:hypothetical protein